MTTIKNKILVPRNLECRREKRKQIDLQRIREYIKNGSIGDLYLSRTFLTKLPDDLVQVGGNLDLSFSYIEDLNNLRYVEDKLDVFDTSIQRLPDNLRVSGGVDIRYSRLNELPFNLKVTNFVYIYSTPIGNKYTNEDIECIIKSRGGTASGVIGGREKIT
jgi:hypothetical protein